VYHCKCIINFSTYFHLRAIFYNFGFKRLSSLIILSTAQHFTHHFKQIASLFIQYQHTLTPISNRYPKRFHFQIAHIICGIAFTSTNYYIHLFQPPNLIIHLNTILTLPNFLEFVCYTFIFFIISHLSITY